LPAVQMQTTRNYEMPEGTQLHDWYMLGSFETFTLFNTHNSSHNVIPPVVLFSPYYSVCGPNPYTFYTIYTLPYRQISTDFCSKSAYPAIQHPNPDI